LQADRQQLRASARLTAEGRSEASSAVYVLASFLSRLRPTFLGASTVGRMRESVIGRAAVAAMLTIAQPRQEPGPAAGGT